MTVIDNIENKAHGQRASILTGPNGAGFTNAILDVWSLHPKFEKVVSTTLIYPRMDTNMRLDMNTLLKIVRLSDAKPLERKATN